MAVVPHHAVDGPTPARPVERQTTSVTLGQALRAFLAGESRRVPDSVLNALWRSEGDRASRCIALASVREAIDRSVASRDESGLPDAESAHVLHRALWLSCQTEIRDSSRADLRARVVTAAFGPRAIESMGRAVPCARPATSGEVAYRERRRDWLAQVLRWRGAAESEAARSDAIRGEADAANKGVS